MDLNYETSQYAKKVHILRKILANYRKENQAINAKDLKAFREVLAERAKLIEALDIIAISPPNSPIQKLQYKQLTILIAELQKERENANPFFR
jgi:hypothetical protein